MQLQEIIKKRQATRDYLDKHISQELIQKILEMAKLAPSAGNLQAMRVIIVKDRKLRQELKAQCRGLLRFTTSPPVILVICSVPEESAVKYEDRGRNLYALQDATIFASYLQLAAVSLGLASCWVGSFNEETVSDVIGLPDNLTPVALITIGYSEEAIRQKQRKDLKELIFREI